MGKKSDCEPCNILENNHSDESSDLLNLYPLEFISCNFSRNINIYN